MKTKKILLVDDDPQQLKLIKLFLADKKFELETALSGKSALRILKNNKYDLIITDMQMPEMDGFTLLKKIRTDLNLHIPVIIATAYTNLNLLEKEIRDNSVTIIHKPFTSDEIMQSVQKSLQKK